MKILVTGSEGFIGKHLVERLEELGHKVIAWDYQSSKRVVNEGLYTSPDICAPEVTGTFDVVFHFAASVSVPRSMEIPQRYISNNINGTVNLLQRTKSKRFVFASTCAADDGKSVYSITKKAAEMFVSLLHPNSLSLRFYNVFGEGNKNNAIWIFTKAILSGNEASLYSYGDQVRDYVYVKDAVEAIVDLGLGELKGIANVGTGRGTRTEDLFKMLTSLLNSSIMVKYRKEKRPGEVMSAVAKSGLKEKYGFKKGIIRTVDWIKKEVEGGII